MTQLKKNEFQEIKKERRDCCLFQWYRNTLLLFVIGPTRSIATKNKHFFFFNKETQLNPQRYDKATITTSSKHSKHVVFYTGFLFISNTCVIGNLRLKIAQKIRNKSGWNIRKSENKKKKTKRFRLRQCFKNIQSLSKALWDFVNIIIFRTILKKNEWKTNVLMSERRLTQKIDGLSITCKISSDNDDVTHQYDVIIIISKDRIMLVFLCIFL